MKVPIKTKEQLLASGWYIDINGNIEHDQYATILPNMLQYLGKCIELEGRYLSHHIYAKGYVWGKGSIMTKQDIINEFFKQ